MSYVHMMIISRARIYNCVSLKSSHAALLVKMQKKAREMLLDPKVREYYLVGREFDLS